MAPSRLVGGWLLASAFLTAHARDAVAQTSASFPDVEPQKSAPAPPAPAPPPAAPAPAPAAPAAATPTPAPPPLDPGRGPSVAPPALPAYTPAPPAPPPAGLDQRPPILPYREGLPVPAGYTVVDRPASGLIAGGLVGFGISYAAGILVGASEGFSNGTGWLAVPLIGPWGAIATRKYECGREAQDVAGARRCVNDAVGEVRLLTFMAMDGLAQTAGALVTLAGLVSTRQELVRDDLVALSFRLPLPGRDGFGLGLSANF